MSPGAAADARAALLAARRTLEEAGIDTANTDAEWMLAHVLNTDRGRLLFVDELSVAQAERYADLVADRARRIPLQHVLGSAAFGPVELAVGPGVFVPRPETEWLLTWAQNEAGRVSPGADRTGADRTGANRTAASGPAAPIRVVDLCSGSGALAIGLAHLLPAASVAAVEFSPQALVWLRRNVCDQPSDISSRIEVIDADVTRVAASRDALAAVGFGDGAVEVLVTNPPYVPSATPVSPEVAHDPAQAVFAGSSGMTVIEAMAELIVGLLAPGGAVGIEHDDTTAAEVVAVLETTGAFTDITAHTDLTGRPRFVTAVRVTG